MAKSTVKFKWKSKIVVTKDITYGDLALVSPSDVWKNHPMYPTGVAIHAGSAGKVAGEAYQDEGPVVLITLDDEKPYKPVYLAAQRWVTKHDGLTETDLRRKMGKVPSMIGRLLDETESEVLNVLKNRLSVDLNTDDLNRIMAPIWASRNRATLIELFIKGKDIELQNDSAKE